ncbi:MAG: methylglyoxal synthase [candidate division KSB1 bacterium]|nr:methylglyoxal synthase [candidate division KSB1 bacterium]
MKTKKSKLKRVKTIALIAHDHKKADLLEWADYNRDFLKEHKLIGTGTTGKQLGKELDLKVQRVNSGPMGGDQQIGAKIADGKIDFLIFFWDPLAPLPHDPDIKALLRIAVVWNIPVACNRATADFLITSQLMHEDYQRKIPDYSAYIRRYEKKKK